MPDRSDYVKYHQSISDELKATQNRVRNLIDNKHWGEDGRHKETILRKVLRDRLPETCRVGTGFICYMDGPSTQQDILITDSKKPTLYKEGDLNFVTSDTVQALIEVKTRLNTKKEFLDVLDKLAEQACRLRVANADPNAPKDPTTELWTGLYIFDNPNTPNGNTRPTFLQEKTRALLAAVNEASQGLSSRVVNCISMGSDVFIRYWNEGTKKFRGTLEKPGWHSYIFNHPPHKGLAPAYFIGNLVMDITSEKSLQARYAWFPIQDTLGKERYKTHWIELGGAQIHTFPDTNNDQKLF